MSEIELKTQIGEFLTLRHPLWIASAHYTEQKSMIDTWAEIRPAALTLKTAHKAPIDPEDKKKLIREKTISSTGRFSRSYYCDGPKQRELIDYEKTAELLKYAKEKLPETKVGISVICNSAQDYAGLRNLCSGAEFCELNLKYIFRFEKKNKPSFFDWASERFNELLKQVKLFVDAFHDLPVFIKISRELSWLPGTEQFNSFIDILVGHGKAGLIIANSLKMDVPLFIADGQERLLKNGVLCGEALYDQTIALIESFQESCGERKIPIVATGGMIDPEHALMALRAGASCVQLCTAFDYYRPNYYNTLCWNFQNRTELLGLKQFSDYISRLRKESVATIYNMPFMYFEQFWSEDIQRRLQKDVRMSERMDVFVMSGMKVVEKWEGALKNRFGKNLGLRILLPDLEGPTFSAIQGAWGIIEPDLSARKNRSKNARALFEKAWNDTQEERKKSIKEDETEASFAIFSTNKCPFYSFYLFDDKVCVSPYPCIRPGQPDIPVYIFFAGSHEYERIKKEADTLFEYANQSKS